MKRVVLVNGLILAALGTLVAPAAAQYKWRTPEGITVYSDVPPPTGAKLMNDRTVDQPALTAAASDGVTGTAPAVELPYELKTVNSKFPVVLYTAPDCAPCALARQHLGARGVPFSEKSIATSADFEAFKTRGFNDNSFPAITVGREKAVGFESGTYDRLLNAAGYPRTSRLPANYKQAAAEPMTAPQPQKLTVSVQRESQASAAAVPAADNRSAIELYRQRIEASTANRPGDSGPSVRF
jgi:hypothetical protein